LGPVEPHHHPDQSRNDRHTNNKNQDDRHDNPLTCADKQRLRPFSGAAQQIGPPPKQDDGAA
jgi:hypothetical protein